MGPEPIIVASLGSHSWLLSSSHGTVWLPWFCTESGMINPNPKRSDEPGILGPVWCRRCGAQSLRAGNDPAGRVICCRWALFLMLCSCERGTGIRFRASPDVRFLFLMIVLLLWCGLHRHAPRTHDLKTNRAGWQMGILRTGSYPDRRNGDWHSPDYLAYMQQLSGSPLAGLLFGAAPGQPTGKFTHRGRLPGEIANALSSSFLNQSALKTAGTIRFAAEYNARNILTGAIATPLLA